MKYIAVIILIILAILGETWGGAAQGTTPEYHVYLPIVEYHQMLPAKMLNSIVGSPTCDDFDLLGTDRLMMWFPTCQTSCGRPFNPMVRDLSQLELIESGTVNLSDCGQTIISFNEPENQSPDAGSAMSLTELISAWDKLKTSLPTHRLTSPQFVRLTDMEPLPYSLADFLTAYGSVPFDITAVHFYGRYNVERSIQQWQDWYATFPSDKPVWITELGWADYSGWQNSEQQAADFLSAMLDDCREHNVELVSWFSVKESEYTFLVPLLRSDGTLTLPGQVWKDYH